MFHLRSPSVPVSNGELPSERWGACRRLFVFAGLALAAWLSPESSASLAIEPLSLGLLLGGGAAIGAGGSLLGANQAAQTAQTKNAPAGGTVNNQDPILAQLQLETLLQLGGDLGSLPKTGGPVQQVFDALLSGAMGDVRRDDVGRVSVLLPNLVRNMTHRISQGISVADAAREAATAVNGTGGGPPDAKLLWLLERATNIAGFTSIEDFFGKLGNFNVERDATVARFQEIQPDIQQGRLDTLLNIARVQSDLGNEIDPDVIRQSLLREIGEFEGESSDRIFQQANTLGFNPAGALGELAEQAQGQRVDSQFTAIQLADALTKGRTNTIAGLSQSLLPAQTLGLATAGQAAQTNLGVGQIAAAQASALASIGAASDNAAAQARGAGIAGASQSIGDALTLGGLLKADAAKKKNTTTNTNTASNNSGFAALLG